VRLPPFLGWAVNPRYTTQVAGRSIWLLPTRGAKRLPKPHQISNALCFFGFFRGLPDMRARLVDDDMKLATTHAIASCVTQSELGPEYFIPSVFNKSVAPAVARDVARAAEKTAVARGRPRVDSPNWA